MLWRLFGSKERLEAALARSTASIDLSPDVYAPTNNNDPVEQVISKSRLWIEGWGEKDEERLRDPETTVAPNWL